MASKSFENPLIPHARMRGLYRALVETRLLGERAGRGRGLPRDFEACWVAPAIDLKPGDLTSIPRNEWLVDHVRKLGTRANRAASASEVARALKAFAAGKAERTALTALDRILCAVGMAMAAKSAAAQGVVTAWLGVDDLTAPEWKHLLNVAAPGDLPLVLVATPGKLDLAGLVQRMNLSTVPVVPVDAGDVIALYRVAQETFVRARADGGLAILECVACGVDPIKLMASQLLTKKISTQRWLNSVDTSLEP
jgi:hypothetical protein